MTDTTEGQERVAALQSLRQGVESAVEPALPGKERALCRVQPGWWIHVYDGVDGEWMWLHVYYAAWGTHVPSQQAMTRVLARDSSGESSEIFESSSNLVRCCTKAEAKKAGLS